MRQKKQQPESQLASLFATSEERVESARKRFEAALTTLANARAYGTQTHAAAAAQALTDAAESYADSMRTHALLVVDYSQERARG